MSTPVTFYYLTVSYCIEDLSLSETSNLQGPFFSEEDRDAAIKEDMSERDLETSQVVNLTKLKLEDGQLVREGSAIMSDEGKYEDEDEEGDE